MSIDDYAEGYGRGYDAALRDALAAIKEDKSERQPLHAWDGMGRATAVIKRLMEVPNNA